MHFGKFISMSRNIQYVHIFHDNLENPTMGLLCFFVFCKNH